VPRTPFSSTLRDAFFYSLICRTFPITYSRHPLQESFYHALVHHPQCRRRHQWPDAEPYSGPAAHSQYIAERTLDILPSLLLPVIYIPCYFRLLFTNPQHSRTRTERYEQCEVEVPLLTDFDSRPKPSRFPLGGTQNSRPNIRNQPVRRYQGKLDYLRLISIFLPHTQCPRSVCILLIP
jgi:hypothetical protein